MSPRDLDWSDVEADARRMRDEQAMRSSAWFTVAEFNSEADGSPVAEDAMGPTCTYGPFPSEAAAVAWLEDGYPDGDKDLRDLWAVGPEDSGELDLSVLNPPETVLGIPAPDRCMTCGAVISRAAEKAVGSGEVQLVWADLEGSWVCPATGDEHELAEVVR
jgi:hypothetical protein